jgi:hypothetical protein
MRAIEFIAREKNGMVALPREYVGKFKKNVRVIILVEDHVLPKTPKLLERKKSKALLFNAVRIKTKNMKISRAAANER